MCGVITVVTHATLDQTNTGNQHMNWQMFTILYASQFKIRTVCAAKEVQKGHVSIWQPLVTGMFQYYFYLDNAF